MLTPNKHIRLREKAGVPYRVDTFFYCPELLLAIELDRSSHEHPIKKEKDAVRDFILKT